MSVIVEVRTEDATGILTLNNAEGRNVLSVELRVELKNLLDELHSDARVKAIVLASTGSVFSAGGDLNALHEETPSSMLERQLNAQPLICSIVRGKKPVIAAVEGIAVGAGLSLAAACDIVVAGKEARFGAVFGKVGLAPDLGLTWTLPRRVSPGRARLMLITGRQIDASTAERWGLVDLLTEKGNAMEEALQVAREIGAVAPLSVGTSRRALTEDFSSLEQAINFEATAQALLSSTEDFSEGYAAFVSKRSARFRGR